MSRSLQITKDIWMQFAQSGGDKTKIAVVIAEDSAIIRSQVVVACHIVLGIPFENIYAFESVDEAKDWRDQWLKMRNKSTEIGSQHQSLSSSSSQDASDDRVGRASQSEEASHLIGEHEGAVYVLDNHTNSIWTGIAFAREVLNDSSGGVGPELVVALCSSDVGFLQPGNEVVRELKNLGGDFWPKDQEKYKVFIWLAYCFEQLQYFSREEFLKKIGFREGYPAVNDRRDSLDWYFFERLVSLADRCEELIENYDGRLSFLNRNRDFMKEVEGVRNKVWNPFTQTQVEGGGVGLDTRKSGATYTIKELVELVVDLGFEPNFVYEGWGYATKQEGGVESPGEGLQRAGKER